MKASHDCPVSICATKERLAAGEYLKLEHNHIINNKQLTFYCKLDELREGEVIRLGHGETEYSAAYAELTSTHISLFEYFDKLYARPSLEHGLKIKDFVSVTIDVTFNEVRVTVGTAGGVFMSEPIKSWRGSNGEIFAVSLNKDITGVRLRWSCSDYSKKIWLFGDSYFSVASPNRWGYYLLKNGYTQYLFSGFPGRDSRGALADFKQALEHGTPEFAVWCLGMNNADGAESVNPIYKECASEFLELCKEKGITPILSTIPEVPERINYHKNELVRHSGCRYIDFAAAVGAEKIGSGWYEGMLSSDRVHPDVLGAQALYAQLLADFPEIMVR